MIYAMLGGKAVSLFLLKTHTLVTHFICFSIFFEFLLLMLRGSSNIVNETKPMPLAGLYEMQVVWCGKLFHWFEIQRSFCIALYSYDLENPDYGVALLPKTLLHLEN